MKAHIKEAYRYIENAKTIIKEKLKKEDGYYNDPKYVKLAGHAAYAGVLVALQPFVEKKNKRLNVDDYKKFLAKRNKKIVTIFNEVYEHLHLYAGYDGGLKVKTIATGFEEAEKIIEWADQNTTILGTIKEEKK